jgi:hypothetical protein
MITRTVTHADFLFSSDNDTYHHTKYFDNALKDFASPVHYTNLEEFLTNVVALKPLIEAEKVEKIKIQHEIFYDTDCNPEFSPKAIALLHELGATLEVRTQKNYEGETLYQVLDRIRWRPGMWLGKTSITLMDAFINGFFMACNGGTKEEPPFYGVHGDFNFNDFIGKFYGKHTTPGWKNLILWANNDDEVVALEKFFELLDEFRMAHNGPNSRTVVMKLLHAFMTEFSTQNDIAQQKQIALLIQKVTDELQYAVRAGNEIYLYDDMLSGIFERSRDNNFLHNWIKTHAPETEFYEHELWSGSDGKVTVTTLIPSNHKQKDYVLDGFEVLIKRFFTMNIEKAKEVKEAFLAEQDALTDAKNALKKGGKKSKK